MYLNRATILGRLTQDPELRQTTGGKNVCNFTVVTNKSWKDSSGNKQEKAEFHGCVVWGKLAEVVGQYLVKGAQVYVEGALETKDWVGQDGVKRYKTEILVSSFIMVGGKSQSQLNTLASPLGAPPQGLEEDVRVEDIPF